MDRTCLKLLLYSFEITRKKNIKNVTLGIKRQKMLPIIRPFYLKLEKGTL